MKKLAISAAALALLTACAGNPYRPVPFDHATSGISTLEVAEDVLPPSPQIRKLATNGQNMASATAGLGLAGLIVGVAAASIEAGIAADQNKRINAVLTSQGFNGEAIFDETFEADLRAQGFEVSTAAAKHDVKRTMITFAAQPDAQPGTAMLDVNGYGYGYQLVGGTKWRPYVVLAVKAYDAKDPAKVLLDNRVEYNAVGPGTVTVNIAGDEAYGFAKVEDIEANPEKAAEGLRNALQAAAHATAALLK